MRYSNIINNDSNQIDGRSNNNYQIINKTYYLASLNNSFDTSMQKVIDKKNAFEFLMNLKKQYLHKY